MSRFLTDQLQTIAYYKHHHPQYEELLDILEEILILREAHRRDLTAPIFPLDERMIPGKIAGGLPLIDFSTGAFDETQPKAYFLDLLSIAEKRMPGETAELARQIREGEVDFKELALNAFYGQYEDEETEAAPEEEQEHGKEVDLIDMFLEESLRPALERVAEKYRDAIVRYGWSEGYCPVCGKEPKIGEIKGEDDMRFLFCNQCGIEWPFAPVKCPFCGNEEQQTLSYFTVDEDERYRVEVCNECKRYIKMVDFRELGEDADLDVEDIATLHLDLLANDEGYD